MWKETKLGMLRELVAARTRYEERFGWPVTFEVEPGRLVLTTGPGLGAVAMPRRLGGLVLADLRIALLTGPVLADTTGQWWLFVTRAADRGAPKHHTELRCLGVQLLPAGSRVVVPCEFDGKNGCPWIERPRHLTQLPPWAAVLAVARRVSAGQPALRQQAQQATPDVGGAVAVVPLPPNENDVFRRIA